MWPCVEDVSSAGAKWSSVSSAHLSRTVVTFGTLSAVARKVPNTAASVASFVRRGESAVATTTPRGRGAIASNVTILPALVALLTAVPATRRVSLRAITRNVTFLVTLVASFGFQFSRAFLGDVAFSTAVVASRCSSLWAVDGLVTVSSTVKTSTSGHGRYDERGRQDRGVGGMKKSDGFCMSWARSMLLFLESASDTGSNFFAAICCHSLTPL